MEWSDLDISKISRLDLCCNKCHKVNVKVKGEDLNCDFCGSPLIEFTDVLSNEGGQNGG